MLAKTMRKAAGLAMRRFSRSEIGNDNQTVAENAEQKIVELLQEHPHDDGLVIRGIHKLIGADQPVVLRAIRELESKVVVEIDTVLHDPLASRVMLKSDKEGLD